MGKKILFCFVLFLIGSVSANYIQGDIYIRDNGRVVFSVNTDKVIDLEGLSFKENRVRGETKELVSLKNGIWSFFLNLSYYDTILLDIHLPPNIDRITSVEGVRNIVGFDKKTISLIDSEEELFFYLNYELDSRRNGFLFYSLFILVLLVAIIFWIRNRGQKKYEKFFPLVNEKEEKIIKALMKGPIRQKQLRKKLKIPKASFSRYIVNLEKKKLLLREGERKNKILRLK